MSDSLRNQTAAELGLIYISDGVTVDDLILEQTAPRADRSIYAAFLRLASGPVPSIPLDAESETR